MNKFMKNCLNTPLAYLCIVYTPTHVFSVQEQIKTYLMLTQCLLDIIHNVNKAFPARTLPKSRPNGTL